jgi:hypothetical protein
MPLTVRVDPDLQVIFVSGEGVVTDADLTEADLLDLTYTGLAKTAAAAAATDPEAASVKIALLVSEIRGMGITRLYQSLRQSKGGRRETRVFTDAAECREWLGLNP